MWEVPSSYPLYCLVACCKYLFILQAWFRSICPFQSEPSLQINTAALLTDYLYPMCFFPPEWLRPHPQDSGSKWCTVNRMLQPSESQCKWRRMKVSERLLVVNTAFHHHNQNANRAVHLQRLGKSMPRSHEAILAPYSLTFYRSFNLTPSDCIVIVNWLGRYLFIV